MSEELDFSNVLAAMDRINRRKEEELARLSAQPDLFRFATQFTDGMVIAVEAEMCHYATVTDHRGRTHDARDVLERVKDFIHADFRRLTGKDYVPSVCRDLDHQRGDDVVS